MKLEKTQYDVIERVHVPLHEIENPLVQELLIGEPVEVGAISDGGRISHCYSCKMKALVRDGVKYKLVFENKRYEVGKRYECRNGMIAEITGVSMDLKDPYPVKGICDGDDMSWTWDGKQLRGGKNYPFDLMREVVWDGK